LRVAIAWDFEENISKRATVYVARFAIRVEIILVKTRVSGIVMQVVVLAFLGTRACLTFFGEVDSPSFSIVKESQMVLMVLKCVFAVVLPTHRTLAVGDEPQVDQIHRGAQRMAGRMDSDGDWTYLDEAFSMVDRVAVFEQLFVVAVSAA
jgi:hypothetical protein